MATFQLPPQIPTQSAAAPYPHYYNPYQPLDIKPYQASLGQAIPAAVNQAPRATPPPPYVQAAQSKQHQAATAGVGPAGTASSPAVPPEFQWVPYGGHHMQAAMYQAAAYHQPQVHHQGAAAAVAYHHQQQQQGAAPGFNPHQAGAMAAMGQHDPAVLQQHFHLTFQQQAGDYWWHAKEYISLLKVCTYLKLKNTPDRFHPLPKDAALSFEHVCISVFIWVFKKI